MAPTQPQDKTKTRTSSAYRSAFLRGEHRFDIVGFRARKDLGVRNTVSSADFHAGGCTWALICRFDVPRRPRADLRTQLQLDTIILQLVSNDDRSDQDVVARAYLRIDDPAPPPSGKEKKNGHRRWPPAVWQSAEANTFPAAARGCKDDDPGECTGTSYWELSVPDAFRESLYVRDDRLSIHCAVDVLQEERHDRPTIRNYVACTVPPPTISRDLHSLLLKEDDESNSKPDLMKDVTFVVDKTEIRAHRIVLAMRSPVFAAELLGEMKEGAAGARVTVDDMTASTFRAMLHFIYTDELNPKKKDNNNNVAMAGDLLVAADRYDLERLRLMCEEILAYNTDAASVMTTLMLVHGRDRCRQLEAACVEYMASHPAVRDAVVATEEYKELKENCGAFVTDVLQKVWKLPFSFSGFVTPDSRRPEKSASMFNSSEVFSGTHEFRIPNFTSVQRRFGAGEYLRSAIFDIGGYDWIIHVYPSGYANGDQAEKYVSIDLSIMTDLADDVWVTKSFRIDDPAGKRSPVIRWSEGFYGPSGESWGVSFMDLATIKKYWVGHDGSLTVHCDITVTQKYSCTTSITGGATEIAVPPSNISSQLEGLLVSKKGSDVTFLVQDTELRAHRLLIAMRAPVLHEAVVAAAAAANDDTTTDRRVRIDDIAVIDFEGMLHFIYTDELPDDFGQARAMAWDMLVVADRFRLGRLMAMCENILCERIAAENVVGTLKLADEHHCQGLKDFCIDHISQPHVLEKVVETEGFKDLKTTCPSLLEEIIIKFSKLSSSKME